MLNLGVIEESHSDWASPIVLVPKTDGSVRFCVDYRKVNAVSKFDAYPMPRVDELLDRLGAARFYLTLDLTKGYWQIPLSPLSKEKTAFTTPFGLHRFVTLPFGLFGAPATFQRLMDKVLRPHSAYAAAYLDDIIIHSNDWQRHMEHLCAVLRALRVAGLTANPRKCAIGRVEVRYLGFHLGHGQVRPQIDKTAAVAACPSPKTKKEVRQFLGLAGYYRRFVPNFLGGGGMWRGGRGKAERASGRAGSEMSGESVGKWIMINTCIWFQWLPGRLEKAPAGLQWGGSSEHASAREREPTAEEDENHQRRRALEFCLRFVVTVLFCVIRHPFCGSSPLTSSSFLPWPPNRVTIMIKYPNFLSFILLSFILLSFFKLYPFFPFFFNSLFDLDAQKERNCHYFNFIVTLNVKSVFLC